MAVHAKNLSFAEEQRQKIAESVQSSTTIAYNPVTAQPKEEKPAEQAPVSAAANRTVTESPAAESGGKKKDVLIGIHVTKEEQAELRQMFCSNGFSLATAYRAAMTYLRQDILDGKACITGNGEILRK